MNRGECTHVCAEMCLLPSIPFTCQCLCICVKETAYSILDHCYWWTICHEFQSIADLRNWSTNLLKRCLHMFVLASVGYIASDRLISWYYLCIYSVMRNTFSFVCHHGCYYSTIIHSLWLIGTAVHKNSVSDADSIQRLTLAEAFPSTSINMYIWIIGLMIS